MNERDEFMKNVRSALGRDQTPATVAPVIATGLSVNEIDLRARQEAIEKDALLRSVELAAQAHQAARNVGWNVHTCGSPGEAAELLVTIARERNATSVLCSAHRELESLGIENAFAGAGIELARMAIDEATDPATHDSQRANLREMAINADIGITGVDYVIAETGSCVIVPRKGVSRLVSLLPPIHIAVVMPGQVLPSLDELFSLRRLDFLEGNLGSYMNLISGPSRTADIEYTLVTGVHGPGEVHMVFVE